MGIDIEDVRRDHLRYYNELWGGHYCRTDHQRWPCRMTNVLDEIERLREQLRIATEFLEGLAAQRGQDMQYPGKHATFAEDALMRMSVV